MARKKREKEKITDPFERARLKKLRAQQRREERKRRRQAGEAPSPRSASPSPSTPYVKDEHEWLRKSKSLGFAQKIMNDHKERPFWMSIEYEGGRGSDPLPISGFYPCTMFRAGGRAYYGFLFREHRDLAVERLEGTKELTERVLRLNPSL